MELYQPTLICLENYLFLEFRWKVFTKLVQLNLRFSWKFLLEYHFKYRRTIPYQIIQGMTPTSQNSSFCTICRYHWNMKTLKISAPNSFWFLRYRYLKIWAKYLIRIKICHFEFTLSLITSGLKDLSSWNLVYTGKFFTMRSPKITLRIHKNKPVFSYFTF